MFLRLCELAAGQISKRSYNEFFSESLITFNKESHETVASAFCDLSPLLATHTDYELH